MDNLKHYIIVKLYNDEWAQRELSDVENELNKLHDQGYFVEDIQAEFILMSLGLYSTNIGVYNNA